MGIERTVSASVLFASQPAVMGKALGIVYRAISAHVVKKSSLTKSMAHIGAVTLIQRFGSAINLNVHFDMLFLDGVYVESKYGSEARFQWIKSLTSATPSPNVSAGF